MWMNIIVELELELAFKNRRWMINLSRTWMMNDVFNQSIR